MSMISSAARAMAILAAGCFMIAAQSASAADKALADRHQAAGVKCTVCHGPDEKNPQEPTTETCIGCHPKDALVKKTAGVKPTNPHVSPHYGADLDCTNCHAGHAEPENYCNQCHQFDFKVK